MSASLVGSEMCIRDSRQAVQFSLLATSTARGVTQSSEHDKERVDLDNHEAPAPCRGRSSGRVP
eukprot:5974661-Alexandrium_andersonii.AAC.1